MKIKGAPKFSINEYVVYKGERCLTYGIISSAHRISQWLYEIVDTNGNVLIKDAQEKDIVSESDL